MDGEQACKEIRDREKLRVNSIHTPIVALTAHAMSGDKERYLALGMDGYLSKPFKFEDLDQLIRAVAVKESSKAK